MKALGGVEVLLHAFVPSTSGLSYWSALALPPWKEVMESIE